MATGTILFPVEGVALHDGSAGDEAPSLELHTTTDASDPHCRLWFLAFDDTTDEQVSIVFRMPADYASGGTFKLQFYMDSATVNEVRWGVAVQAVTPGDSTDMETLDPVGEGGGFTSDDETVPGTAGFLDESSVAPGMDSAAAGDYIIAMIRREGSHANDDATGDAHLVAISFEYTTS